MPFFQVMSTRANNVFHPTNVGSLDVGCASPGTSLGTAARTLGIALNARDVQVLDDIPESIQHAIVSIMRYAITQRVPAYFAWSPAYDYAVKVWEARGVEDSPPAITVHIEGPYPDAGRP